MSDPSDEYNEDAFKMEHDKLVPIIYNSCYGGWEMSDTCKELMETHHGSEISFLSCEIYRHDYYLAFIIEKILHDDASSEYASLRVKWVPEEKIDFYRIHEYDGKETPHFMSRVYELYMEEHNKYTEFVQKLDIPDLSFIDLKSLSAKILSSYKDLIEEKCLRGF